MQEYVDSNVMKMKNLYVYGNYIDEVLAAGGTSSVYFLQDHLYSPVAVLDTNGSTVER
ncbi:hypothetical protein STSP2_00588 [Anaerohalosphaera lusitana]|uniref:Uncharacterized protein n=1 Tax=Anaerohalosphaera lusitana TaxID=1936003 RepID=A0A1U9NHP2_9BACT|nr:hypothetical protein [Anaerohalosphaera lusitana]AQT67441.1 hypothetical protein STSP2_00588 [Anaerohalosphaera lusitana]